MVLELLVNSARQIGKGLLVCCVVMPSLSLLFKHNRSLNVEVQGLDFKANPLYIHLYCFR
jgi:hypothetical protein